MKTITAETIMCGEKANSMYQLNSVHCKADREDMERFYKDSNDLSPKNEHRKPNGMHKYNINDVELNRDCSLIIEL